MEGRYPAREGRTRVYVGNHPPSKAGGASRNGTISAERSCLTSYEGSCSLAGAPLFLLPSPSQGLLSVGGLDLSSASPRQAPRGIQDYGSVYALRARRGTRGARHPREEQ